MDESTVPFYERYRTPLIVVTVAVVFILFAVFVLDINMISVLVNGLQVGAVYSLVALGLALVYKATRVLNFAQGELGTVPAFLVFLILVNGDRSVEIDIGTLSTSKLLLATLIAIVVGAVLAVLVNVLVVQRLADASPVTSLVATAGVALLFSSAELIFFEAKARKFPRFVEGSPCFARDAEGFCTSPLAFGGVVVPWHTIIVIAVLAVAAALLAVFFRTPPGVALLATAQEPFAAELHGISVRSMSTLAWGTAGALAAIGGVLGAGVFEAISPGLMTTTFLIPAFTAAVLGGITSMVGAVVGGLLLGITVAFANSFVLAQNLTSVLPGPPQIATFLVLLLVLLVRPRGLLGKEA
ncbi:MAG: branched-chain amino acid ABC transporter permease [Actinobacteria bacterium]|nr:branched-chain amino acid ABC transporter permease [Actinomycetota bacterium]